jgi:hypothetical protein
MDHLAVDLMVDSAADSAVDLAAHWEVDSADH